MSTAAIFKAIYRENGIKGFASTASMTYPKRLLRESSRLSVMNLTNNYLARQYPEVFPKDSIALKLMSALVSIKFNILCVVPIEQLIAYRIMEKKRYRDFFRERFSSEGFSSLYKGAKADVINQVAVWGVLMTVDHYTKRLVDRFDPDMDHPYARQGFASLAVSCSLISCVLPINFIKARIQMDRDLQNRSLKDVAQKLYRQFGMRGFYSGLPPVFLHTMLHATFYGVIFDHFFKKENP